MLEVVREAAGPMNRYPDMAVAGADQALAERLDVPAGHVATGHRSRSGCSAS